MALSPAVLVPCLSALVSTTSGVTPMADGCRAVYVDVGTNRGVQIRKLFEPRLYPGAPFVGLFDKEFGTNRSTDPYLCAFGFEPNPPLTERLRSIADVYNRMGWRTHIFTETGVGVRDGISDFYYYSNPGRNVGSSFRKRTDARGTVERPLRARVRQLDLAAFLVNHVHARRLPVGSRRMAKVVMKMDIEGTELHLLPHLIRTKALCGVDRLVLELHPKFFASGGKELLHYRRTMKQSLAAIKELWAEGRCKTVVLDLDDETYAFDNGVLMPSKEDWSTGNVGQYTPLPDKRQGPRE